MPKFVRPENLIFPTTYREFSSVKDGEENKFRIQEVPEESFDEAIDLLDKYFFAEETVHVSKKIAESEEKRGNSKQLYREVLSDKLSIGCFNENSGELVAVNVMAVSSKDDEKFKVEDETTKEIIELFDHIRDEFNVFEVYNVDQYLTSFALCVKPSYRGHGIATEILKARVEILKAFNLTVTSTCFTTIGSQVAAKKANFEETYAISYDELGKKFPTFDFSKANTKFLKKMSFKV